MRITTLILLTTLLQVSASSLAQKISIDKKNASIQTILNEISKQSGYDFFYDANALKKIKPISVVIKNADLDDAVRKSLEGLPLSYSIDSKTVIIKEAKPSFLDRIIDRFAAVDVRGRILDEAGNPLVGATIQVKGKAQTYKTKENGEFEIKGVDDDAVLLVSYVGFKTLEIALKDAVMPLEIKLNVATGELEEVKVVYNTGYQELNKERSTGSFVQIDNELFNRAVGTNVLDRILNVTSGLISNPVPNGGNSGNIVIRGYSTIRASKDALVVVDNFPYDGDLGNLNPNDIESVTVLKDAAAASIWGVRAGNGVVVITTKKGRFNQSTSIGFNSNVTIGQKPDLFYIPYMSSKDMIDFEKLQFGKGIYNEYDDFYPSFNQFPVLPQSIEILLAARKKNMSISGYNALADPVVTAKLEKLSIHDVRSDINKYLLKTSLNQQYALNLSGGGANFNYYSSLGYDKNNGHNLEEDYNRLSLNFTNTWRPIKSLEISSSIVHTRVKNITGVSNYGSSIPQIGISPYTILADDQGNPLAIPRDYRTTYVDTTSYPGLLDWHYKPLEDYKYIDNTSQNYDTRLSAILKYTITPWLKAEVQYQNLISQASGRIQKGLQSYEVRNGINKLMNKDATGKLIYPWPLGDVLDLSNLSLKAWSTRGSLRFDQQFGKHQVNAFAGMELRETNAETNFSKLYGFDPQTYLSKSIDFVTSFPVRPSGTSPLTKATDPIGVLTRNGSIFGNLAYNFSQKYLATLSGRIDQSNFFGVKANLRRVPLWHAGLAWNVHLEDFYHVDWLSKLKLSASYGYTGNTNSGATSYATFQSISTPDGLPVRNISFGRILTPNNPQLRWERVKMINMGLDFVLKNNSVSGSVEYYQKTGLDLLGPITTDPTTGVFRFIGNNASIKGKGIDIIVNTVNIKRGLFEWNTNWLLSFNKDRVTAYGGTPPTINSMVVGSQVDIGDPLYSLYSYKFGGLDPINGSPRIYLADTISSFNNYDKGKKEDLVFNGQRNPKFFGSFRNSLRWNQISLSANITYKFGHYFRKSSIEYLTLLGQGWVAHNDYKFRWMKPGDELTTNVPSLPLSVPIGRESTYLNSDILVEKADHIRLQDIRLDYRLDKSLLRETAFKQISFYMYAANLGIIWRSNRVKIDPDAYAFGNIPIPKTIAFGISAHF